MKKLYSLMYPSVEVAKVDDLYIRGWGYITDLVHKEIHIMSGGQLNFCTYYNSFSLEKWHKYTTLSSLYLKLKIKGHFRIDIYTKYLTAGDYLDKLLSSKVFTNKNSEELVFDLSEYITLPGILYFEITAYNGDCYFYSGEYSTSEEYDIPNIGISICTFKREAYIQKFVSNFNKYDYLDNLYTFISDNGKTLSMDLENERIHIFKNKNFGGAGGFTRSMLEIKDYNLCHENKISYILLMDDDIVIDFNIFERLTAFLALKKVEYENYFVAGSMCSLDYPFLQYERTASWRGNSFIQSGANLDLRDINTIVANEREDRLNNGLAGWWFSCFSTKIVAANNYPFPCFFRGDDMEFTLRNGSNIITLNGLNVWHEPFYKKYSIISENYYLYRNTLVINTLYLPDFGYKNTIKYLLKPFLKMLLVYDYKSAELLLRAWKDYCKGVTFFAETDPEDLNKELMKNNYKMIPISEAIEEYRFDDINSAIYNVSDKNRIQSLFRHLSLNGFLIPKCFYRPFSFALVGFGARYINFYKTKQVFNFDPFTQKGYFTNVSKKKVISLLIGFIKQKHYFKKNYKKICKDYQTNFHLLQTEEFWRNYLDI